MTSLVKQIDSQVAKSGNLKSFVVILTDDADKTADTLKKLASDQGITHVPLTLMESFSGPPEYQIAKDADVTVMLWRGHKVKANHAYSKGKLTDSEVKTILSDLSKIQSD